MLEFIKNFGAKVFLETLLVRAFHKILRVVVAQIGLEDTSSTDRQEVFIDDRIELDCAAFDQGLNIGIWSEGCKTCGILDRIGEITKAFFANASPCVRESRKGVAQRLHIFSRV